MIMVMKGKRKSRNSLVFVVVVGCDILLMFRLLCRMKILDVVRKYMCVLCDVGNFVVWEFILIFYVVEVMNCLLLCSYDVVVFVVLVRIGKMLGLIDGWIFYNIVCDLFDMLVVQMIQDKVQEYLKWCLVKMFCYSLVIVRRFSFYCNDNNVYDKMFCDGLFLKIGWLLINVFLFLDFKCVVLIDYDWFFEDVDGEGDVFLLVLKCIIMFMLLGMILVESLLGWEIIDIRWKLLLLYEVLLIIGIFFLYNCGDCCCWYWLCLYCGEYFQLLMVNMIGYCYIVDFMEVSEVVWIQCLYCYKLIELQQKCELNNCGVWLWEGQYIDCDGNIIGEVCCLCIVSFWMEGLVVVYQIWV